MRHPFIFRALAQRLNARLARRSATAATACDDPAERGAFRKLQPDMAAERARFNFHGFHWSPFSFARSMALFSHADLSCFSLAMRSGVRRTL